MWYEHYLFVEAIIENPSQMRGGVIGESSGEQRRANYHRPLPLLLRVLPNHPACLLLYFLHPFGEPRRSTEKHHLQLTFRCEGGGGGSRVETPKKTTSGLRLDTREMGGMSKERNKPPLARVQTRGRWWWWEACWNNEKKPPPAHVWTRGRWCGGSCVEIVKNNHLQLVFGCKGGGSGGRWSKRRKQTTSSSRLNAREVVWWQAVETTKKNHLQLAFEREGGGVVGDGSKEQKETTSGLRLNVREVVVVGVGSKLPKWTTSGSHLDVREVVVVGVRSKHRKKLPLARAWTRGR